ncbi:phage tail tip lysozyme [Labrys neptuniae]
MPRFPDYRSEIGLNPGTTPQVRTGAEQIGQGLQSLGQGLGEAAAGLAHYQQRVQREAAFDDDNRLDLHQRQRQSALNEAAKAMPAQATGFTASFVKSGLKPDADFLATISPQNRERIAGKLRLFNEGLLTEASNIEYRGRGAYETNSITGDYQTYLNTIRRDPSQRGPALIALNAKIDGATSIPAADRVQLKRDIAAGSAIEWAKGTAGADPDRMSQLAWGAKTTLPKGEIGPAQATRESAAMSYFIGRGYSPEQAAGIVGNLVHESGGLAPASRNPGDGSDGSDSVGIAQWNGARARNLQAFAAGQGKDWRDFGVQLAFVDHELNTDYAGVKGKLLAARTPDEAAGTFVTGYERPRGSEGGAAAAHGWDNRRNQARRLAAGTYAPGEVEEKAPDPNLDSLTPAQRDSLVSDAQARQRQGQAVAQGNLEPRIQAVTRALTTVGRYEGRLPSEAEFTAGFGPQEGARRYADFQRTVNLGADIDTIKAMTPEEQSSWLAGFAPKGDGAGSDTSSARDRYARAQQAIALNQAFRRKDPNAYVRSLHPEIDQLWNDAGTSPERLKTALSATNAAMDRLGIPAEDRRLLPKAMVDQALAAFGDASKPLAERLAPLRAVVTASADPKAQQAIFAQMVSSGLPPMLEYTAAAYAKGDAPLAERLAAAALGNSGSGEQPGGADAAGSFSSPAAAANTAAGPAALRSLSGPAIDLGPAASQAIGSSLLGDERVGRTEALRARMIDNTMRSNGGDRVGAIAQTDRDLASLQENGRGPGMFMQEPGGPMPVQVAQVAGASTPNATPTMGSNERIPLEAEVVDNQMGNPHRKYLGIQYLSTQQLSNLPGDPAIKAAIAQARANAKLDGPPDQREEHGFYIFLDGLTRKYYTIPMTGERKADPNGRGYKLQPNPPPPQPNAWLIGSAHIHPTWPNDLEGAFHAPDILSKSPEGLSKKDVLEYSEDDQVFLFQTKGAMLIFGPPTLGTVEDYRRIPEKN